MNSDLIFIIKEKASLLLPEIITIRRELHANPELSFEEEQTADFIAAVLSKADIPYTKGWAGHGIVAIIQGQSDKVVALRGDIDALPITETNDVTYKSKQPGIMHACGHDVHTASLLGVALILNQIKESLPYTIKFIFQPGEEKLPGLSLIHI